MKLCISCHQRFEHDDWHCPHCDFQPGLVQNTPLLAPDLQSGFEAKFFEPLAKGEQGHFWFEARNKIVLWALQKYFPQMQSFLEVGCGTGFVLSGIRQAYPDLSLVGSEIFIEGLEIAKKRLPDIPFIQMDGQKIPYDTEFDVIGSFDVLEHIADDETVLTEMFKAVKSGGGILLSVPQHPWLWTIVDDYGHHQRRYTRKELVSKVTQAGFEVVHVTSFMTFTLPMLLLSRFLTRNQTVETYDASSELQLPAFVNIMLRTILRAEGLVIRSKLSLPIGASLLLVAKRP